VSVEASGHGLASGPERITYRVLYPIGVAKTGFRRNLDNLTGISTVLRTNRKGLQTCVVALGEGTENTGGVALAFQNLSHSASFNPPLLQGASCSS
jgi:hypothetical protein